MDGPSKQEPFEKKPSSKELPRHYETMDNKALIQEIIELQDQLHNIKFTQLGERVKELNCIYELSRLFNKLTILFDEKSSLEDSILLKKKMLSELIHLLPAAWQYPEITTVRITVDKDVLRLPNFQETPWKLSSKIMLFDKEIGELEIFYLEDRPKIDGSSFLKEERFLMEVICELLSQNLERLDLEYRVKMTLGKREILLHKVHNNLNLLQDMMKDTLDSIQESQNSLQTPSFVQSPLFDAKKVSKLIEYLETLASEERFLMADRVRSDRMDIEQIKNLLKKSQSTCSHHLQLLIKSGLITGWRQKKLTYYSFNQQKVQELLGLWNEWIGSMPFIIKDPENSGPRFFRTEELTELNNFIIALGHTERFTILLLLKIEPRNLTKLEQILGKPQSSIYHHLQILKEQNLVTGFSSGKFTDYHLVGERFQYMHQLFVNWLQNVRNFI